MDCEDKTLGRRQLQFVPEQVAEKCAVSAGMYTEFLHHNYIGCVFSIFRKILFSNILSIKY